MSLSLLASPWTTSRRSSTAFDIPPDDRDAITKLIGFPRPDLKEAVISFPLKYHENVRHSLSEPFEQEPTADLGAFVVLPLELLGQILLHHVDIESVLTFRKINRRARHVADSLHEYKAITTHGLDFLCALLRTQLASHKKWTLAMVHTLLCEKSCSACGHFAAFVSLPYWERCCFTCLQFDPKLEVEDEARVLFTKDTIPGGTPILLTIPGRYGTSSTWRAHPCKIVAFHHVDVISDTQPIPNQRASKYQHMSACALPFFDTESRQVEAGVACAGCQLALSKDLQSNNFTQRAHDVAERLYTKEDFLKHFRWCRWAQFLWKSSGGGQFTPPEMPLVARMGQLLGSL